MKGSEKLKAEEQKFSILNQQHGICGVCGIPMLRPQIAHRIPKTKYNLKTYGKEVIHHRFNLVAVCSLKCNSDVLLSPATHPIEAKALIDKIKREL